MKPYYHTVFFFILLGVEFLIKQYNAFKLNKSHLSHLGHKEQGCSNIVKLQDP